MKEPLRVLQVFTSMNKGGAEAMIMNYYRNIDRSKVQFDFLLHRQEKYAFDYEIEEMGGKIYRLPAISISSFFSYNKGVKAFFEAHPEYKIIHSHINALSFVVLKYAQKNCSTRIAHSHTSLNPYSIFELYKKNVHTSRTLKNFLYHQIRSLTPKYTTHNFACGKKAGEWLYGDNEFKIINNAIDTSMFLYDKEKSISMKKELDVENNFVIGHVGRFDNPKNHYFLIDVFNEILKQEPKAKLLLVGNGNLKDSIIAKVEELGISASVNFLGFRDDIESILQAVDLFIFPSLYEGFPVTLIEAQAASVSIIASDTITKEVQFSDLVHFMSLKQPEKEWANLAIKLKNNKKINRYEVISENGYDIKSCANELSQFYLNL